MAVVMAAAVAAAMRAIASPITGHPCDSHTGFEPRVRYFASTTSGAPAPRQTLTEIFRIQKLSIRNYNCPLFDRCPTTFRTQAAGVAPRDNYNPTTVALDRMRTEGFR